MFAQNGFMAQLTDLEMLSMILACVMHDAGHPGVLSEPDDPCSALVVCLMIHCFASWLFKQWNQCVRH